MGHPLQTWLRKKIGENLRKIRKRQGLTMKELCKKLMLPESMSSYISDIEHGRQGLSEKQIKKFAGHLDTNVSEFYAGIALSDEAGGLNFPLTNSEQQMVSDFRLAPDAFKIHIARICNSAKTLMPLSEEEIEYIEKIRQLDISEIKALEEALNGLIEKKKSKRAKPKNIIRVA